MASRTRVRFWVSALLGLLACSAQASADPVAIKAEIIWARGERLYLALSDSLALAEGDQLTLLSRGKPVATGVVTAILDGELVAARVTGGSLKRVKKLQGLRVLAERPPLRAAALLRLGFPSARRSNPLFRCEGSTLRAPGPPGTYRVDPIRERSWRLVRSPASGASEPWPDTLLVELFDEVADEEIALERGELDVAVFWPGDLSPHMREHPRWRAPLFGRRARGFLASAPPVGGDRGLGIPTRPDSASLSLLNEGLFRGDLAPWPPSRGGDDAASTQSAGASGATPSAAARFEVDRSCPGWQDMERYLNRGEASRPGRSDAPRARVLFVEELLDGAVLDSLHVTPLFAVRCPVVLAPPLRPYVRALGTDALVDMIDCPPRRRAP